MRLAVNEFLPKSNTGKKKDIILIHGTGAKGEMWQKQVNCLVEQGWRCIVPDLRGHGLSPEPKEITSLEVHIQDLLDTLPAYDISYPAVFLGHSLGSIVSIVLAERDPSLAEKILAVSMPGKVPRLTTEMFRLFLKGPYHVIRDKEWHKNFAFRERVLLETDHFTLNEVVRNFADINYVKNIPAINCPVHFAVGRFDPVAPFYEVIRMHKALPNSSLHIFEWAAHNCMDTHPNAFNQWLMKKLLI
jgi:pimeloyl-ACP methyl ester carboxylesterase